MTSTEFRALLEGKGVRELLAPCLHENHIPYVFDTRPDSWNVFRTELADRLNVNRDEIRVVGSGRFGFSLKPGANFKGFSDNSDIDILIVNADLFDGLWQALLEAAYPRPPWVQKIGGWLADRRNEVYTGWISPLKIKLDIRIVGPRAKPVLDFNQKWFDAFKLASRHPPRRHEDIQGRLYRTWNHAELYHLDSLAALKKSIQN